MMSIEDGGDESFESVLADINQDLKGDVFQPEESYLARMELVLANRTNYPYPNGKEELAEYLKLWKSDIFPDGGYDRFRELGRNLRKHHIIPDSIAEHAKKLVEERTAGPRVPDVIDFTQKKMTETIVWINK